MSSLSQMVSFTYNVVGALLTRSTTAEKRWEGDIEKHFNLMDCKLSGLIPTPGERRLTRSEGGGVYSGGTGTPGRRRSLCRSKWVSCIFAP